MNVSKIESILNGVDNDKVQDLLKDIAYNLRRLILLNGGGQWLGVRTITIPAKKYVMVDFISEMASKLLFIINPNTDKEIWLFNDSSYTTDEGTIKSNSFVLGAGLMSKILLEYKEGIYAYNPYDVDIEMKIDQYLMRTCYYRV